MDTIKSRLTTEGPTEENILALEVLKHKAQHSAQEEEEEEEAEGTAYLLLQFLCPVTEKF